MRSYVDPIINAAVISQVDLRRHLLDLLQLDFPERFLPTFLHEGTHHACFMSPLGSTLALLRMRAFRRATKLRTKPGEDHWDLLEDVLRQEVTMELLRPLSEGLACFSELDSLPGKSNVITTPMLSAFFNFGGSDHAYKSKDVMREHGVNAFLMSLLYRARLDPDLTHRRENVLAGRFPMKYGGYLPGYMAVKNVWAKALSGFERPRDAELFSMYLRSYFYDDYALIAVILDNSQCEHNAANAIGDYILGRLKKLETLDWDAALEEFESNLGRMLPSGHAGAPIIHPSPGGLCNDPQRHELGMAALEELVSELYDDGLEKLLGTGIDDDELVQGLMRNLDAHRLRKRELLCLGSLEAEVEVNAFHRVAVRPKGSLPGSLPMISVAALENVEEGTGDGSLEFYLIPSDNARASAIVRGNELVYVLFEGNLSEERKAQLSSLFGTRSKDLRIIAEQEANLEFVVANNSIGIVRGRIKKSLPQDTEKVYRWLATLAVSDDRWQSAADVLSSGGLFKLLGTDAEFIRGLAFLGVATSVNSDKSELIEIAKKRGIDLIELIEKAKAIQAASGFPTILDAEEAIGVIV
jgi:hypothetical protein